MLNSSSLCFIKFPYSSLCAWRSYHVYNNDGVRSPENFVFPVLNTVSHPFVYEKQCGGMCYFFVIVVTVIRFFRECLLLVKSLSVEAAVPMCCLVICSLCWPRKDVGSGSRHTLTSPADRVLSSTNLWNCFSLSSALKANCFLQWNKAIHWANLLNWEITHLWQSAYLSVLFFVFLRSISHWGIINLKEWADHVGNFPFLGDLCLLF